MDYLILVTQTNFTAQADTTYLITNAVTLSGTVTFEGGSILKMGSNASLTIAPSSQINWLTSPFRPLVITAKDDNSVGDTIAGSTGTPTNYYSNPALNLGGIQNITISNLRVSYAQQAVYASANPLSVTLSDAQLYNCSSGVYVPGQGDLYLNNVLMANFGTALNLSFANGPCSEHDIRWNSTGSPKLHVLLLAAARRWQSELDVGKPQELYP